MTKNIIFYFTLSFFIIAAGSALGQAVHTYIGFPVYPPEKAYFFERRHIRTFTISLFPQEDLEYFTQAGLEIFKQEIERAAKYIEENARLLGWKLIEKKSESDSGNFAYRFIKETGGYVRKVNVQIHGGKPFFVKERMHLPESFGRITYIFEDTEESSRPTH